MEKKWRNRFFKLASLIILVIIGGFGYEEYNRRLPDTHHLKPVFELQASDFAREFETNESKANAQYLDRPISVHGVINTLQKTDTSTVVFLNEGNASASVMCLFDEESDKEATKLKRGDSVTIKGICTGYLMDVVMVRCVVDRKK
jgi:hypothetical protein